MAGSDELESRRPEFEYAQRMARFFETWIKDNFGRRLDVRCDEMAVGKTHALARPGVHTLLRDHRERGESTWHFYLANFRPLWTDSMSEGYHSENMCMSMWRRPRDAQNAVEFMAQKNCTEVSYELTQELLRQAGHKDASSAINDVWSRHFSGDLSFVAYGADHAKTQGRPEFLTIDASMISTTQ